MSNSRRRTIIVVLVFLCALAVTLFGVAPEVSAIPEIESPDFSRLTPCRVIRMIDDDAIVVDSRKREATVRLIGVDTPETVPPSKPAQYYGKEARRFTRNLLKGEQVYLIVDAQAGRTDKYDRQLAYVYRAPDGLFVNAEIIRQGYGRAYTRTPFKHLGQFRQLQRFARQAKKGLWSKEEKATVAVPAAPPAAPAVKPKPEAEDVTVFVTRTGKKYHKGTCQHLRRSRIPMKLSQARRMYEPCGACRPPK